MAREGMGAWLRQRKVASILSRPQSHRELLVATKQGIYASRGLAPPDSGGNETRCRWKWARLGFTKKCRDSTPERIQLANGMSMLDGHTLLKGAVTAKRNGRLPTQPFKNTALCLCAAETGESTRAWLDHLGESKGEGSLYRGTNSGQIFRDGSTDIFNDWKSVGITGVLLVQSL